LNSNTHAAPLHSTILSPRPKVQFYILWGEGIDELTRTFNNFPLPLIQKSLSVMKALILVVFLLFISVSGRSLGDKELQAMRKSNPGFIENKGQITDQNHKPNSSVRYLLNTPGMNVQLRSGGWSYDLYSIGSRQSTAGGEVHFHRIDFGLIGSTPNCRVETSDPSPAYVNYYNANTPPIGITNVHGYLTVIYKGIYPGIDLRFETSGERPFEYSFILQPGADIRLIKLKVGGPERVRKYHEGIRCRTSIGDVDEIIPLCYYELKGQRFLVKGSFKKMEDHIYGFSFDKTIPADAVSVIDPLPTRVWGTYFGGANVDNGFDCSLLPNGNVVMISRTTSPTNIATTGAYQTNLAGDIDAYIACFNPDGGLVWSTYYGGQYDDQPACCCSDQSGNIYMGGVTKSPTGIATPGVFQPGYFGMKFNGYLTKFSSAGMRIWGTYTGGDNTGLGDSGVNDCSCDPQGNVFVVGSTASNYNISTPGAFQFARNTGNLDDGYIQEFSADGQRLWGTYYGGPSLDAMSSVSSDESGHVFVLGRTYSSTGIASTGAYQTTISGSTDLYISLFQNTGEQLWGSYFGGEGMEYTGYPHGCKISSSGDLYFVGNTNSTTGISTPGGFMIYFQGGTQDGFIAKFSMAGSRIWGTYYGGPDNDALVACDVNSSGKVLVAGTSTSSGYLVSPAAYQLLNRGNGDAVLAKFGQTGQELWGTFYGGTLGEWGSACIFGPDDAIYLCGDTYSDNHLDMNKSLCTRNFSANYIASPDAYQNYQAGSIDGFLVKFKDCHSPDTATQIYGPVTICPNATGIVYSIDALQNTTDYNWCVTNGLTITSGQHTTSITVSAGSTVSTDTISVYGINSCDNGFPQLLIVNTLAGPSPSITGPNTSCTGTQEAYHTEAGMNGYTWTVSSGGIINSQNNNLCTVTWNQPGAQWIKVNYTDAQGCAASTSFQYDVLVDAGAPVGISISSTSNSVCAGTPVTFTATPVNPGSSPVYLWKVNGVTVGGNSSTCSYIPATGDVVTCMLTSSNTVCTSNNPATSNSITMIVTPGPPVGISLSPSSNPVCDGTSVTFVATPVNGGTTPAFQWFVNGTPFGINSQTFSFIPNNGDLVSCTMTSSEICVTGNPASSIQYPVSVSQAPIVTFTLCFDTITTVSAKPFKLKGGLPLGGTYSGPGVNPITSVFTPSIAGIGTKSISYSYSNAALCSAAKARNIIVQSAALFTCGNTLTDIRDHTIYPTVQIGTQCWFSANLNYGNEILLTQHQVDNCIPEKYRNPASSFVIASEAKQQYPASVYQWDELMQYINTPATQGLCPPGWHVPTESDWTILFNSYTSNAFAGYPLFNPLFSGFNGLFSGVQHMNLSWDYHGFATFFWSSDKDGSSRAWSHGMNSEDPSVSSYSASRANGFSVRCIKD